MAARVVFHIGVPKSGSTYLQDILWSNAARLRAEGVLLPAGGHKDHRWGSLVVREDGRLRHRQATARGAWERIVADVRAWPGTAVVSHEFYGGASADQALRAVESLGADDVHLVVTARNPLESLTSGWQEVVKYGKTVSLDDFSLDVSQDPADIWNWRALDAAEVLDRWGDLVPADRVHVLPVPTGDAPRELLWQRFAGLFVPDPDAYAPGPEATNVSVGLVECETLRRVGPHLAELTALPRSVWVRSYLAETVLAGDARERFWPGPERIEECRARADRAVEQIGNGGFDVVGDLDDLVVPDQLPVRRTPEDVSEQEVADRAAEVVATLLTDLRARTREARAAGRRVRRLQERLSQPEARPPATATGRDRWDVLGRTLRLAAGRVRRGR